MDDNRKLVFATYLADNIVMQVDLRVNTLEAKKKTGVTYVKMVLSAVPFAGLGINATDAIFTAIGGAFTSFWIENRPFLIFRITTCMYDYIQPLDFTEMRRRENCHNVFVDAFEKFVVFGNPVFKHASELVGPDGTLRYEVQELKEGKLLLSPLEGGEKIQVEGRLTEYKKLYQDDAHIKTLNGFSNLGQTMRRYEGVLTDLSVLQVVQMENDENENPKRQYYMIANVDVEDTRRATLNETTKGAYKKGFLSRLRNNAY